MPAFAYTARTRDGKVQKGTVEESSKEAALNQLMLKGVLVTSIEEVKKKEASVPSALSSGAGKKRRLHQKVTIDDLTLFSRQLGTMLDSGVTLLKALNILIAQIESRRLLEALEQVKKDVEEGKTFRDALAKHPKIFSAFWINLVETGEASGHLSTALSQIASFLETSGTLQRKLISALMYPMILVGVSIVAVIIFITKIIPIFSGIFSGFNVELPPLTVAVINLSNILSRYLLVFIGAIVIAVVALRQMAKTPAGKSTLDRIRLKMPLIGDLTQMVIVERFASGLSTLLESGVSILHALDIVAKTLGNTVYEEALARVKDQVREGKSLAAPLSESGIFPVMVVQMITVGEEIGELGKMLQRVSLFYSERANTTIERLTTLVEPVILVGMGGVVGVLVLSMFMPIFKLSQLGG